MSTSPNAVKAALAELEAAQDALYETFDHEGAHITLAARTLRLRQARARYDALLDIEPATPLHETCYDIEPVTGDAAPVAAPTITMIEGAALGALDVAERVSEPVSPFDVARGAVRLAAGVARLVRGRRS
jgi:hypothetical protein